jgi:hypothetical protein
MGDGEWVMSRRAALLAGGGLIAALLGGCSSSPQGSSGSTNGDSGVEMSFTNMRRLTGSQDGKRTDVTAPMPQRSGHASGTFAAEPVDAHWTIAYNASANQTVLPATVAGTLAGVATSLSGIFNLAPNFLFQSGTITGSADGSSVSAQAESTPGESTSSVNVHGEFAGTPFSLYGTLTGDLSSGYVQGTVAGKPFKVTASTRSQAIRLTGNYNGPSDLLAIIVGVLLYFLG